MCLIMKNMAKKAGDFLFKKFDVNLDGNLSGEEFGKIFIEWFVSERLIRA